MFPTPFTVQREAWSSSTDDAHGNAVPVYASPVDVPVYGWGPVGSGVDLIGRSELFDLIDVYAPALATDVRDRWTVGGETYKPDGDVQEWGQGPFGFSPGVVLRLKRIEG